MDTYNDYMHDRYSVSLCAMATMGGHIGLNATQTVKCVGARSNTDEAQSNYAERKKPDPTAHMLYSPWAELRKNPN